MTEYLLQMDFQLPQISFRADVYFVYEYGLCHCENGCSKKTEKAGSTYLPTWFIVDAPGSNGLVRNISPR